MHVRPKHLLIAGVPLPTAVCVSPENWAKSHDHLYGCLYNHAYWWEAREVWEGLWQLR